MHAGRRISADIPIEELVNAFPSSVPFLIARGLPCLVCGEPAWGTLGEMAARHGLKPAETDTLVHEMNLSMGKEDE